MTGRYETELGAIVNAPAWGIPNIDQLGQALDHLVNNLTVLVASPGGKGNWATSASDSFAVLQKKYFAARLALPAIDGAIANANNAKSAARDAYGRLPGISVPDDVKLAVAAAAVGTAIAVPILGPTPIAAVLVLGMVEGMFGNQREAQAKAALDTLQKDLSTPAGMLRASNLAIASTPVGGNTDSVTQNPADGGSQSGSGSVTSRPSPAAKRYYAGSGFAGLGGSGAGQGFAPGAPGSSVGGGSAGSDGASHSSTSADGDLSGGTVPGTGYNGGIGLAGSGGGLGAEGLRGLGIGAGSAASAAAVAAAARMGGLGNLGSGSLGGGGLGGGGLGGGAGGGLRVGGLGAAAGKGGSGGTGGLLGSGAKATVAASSAEEGAGGAAGSKSGNSMMGGQGGGAAGREKEKRSGLGGLMAPKLEDDEELGPRSAGARAGGRSGGRDAAGE